MPVITKPNQYFDINLYSGNSGTQTITNSGLFQPDFVWSKCRNSARSHRLCNSVGGSTREMYSDATTAEQTDGSMTSFTSTGFNLNNATGSQYNTSGENYVSWQWKAGGTAVTNTAGSISSQVSANPTAGFSVVTYTSPNTSVDETVGHGLGAVPQFIITKNRDASWNWDIYHKNLSSGEGLVFEDTGAGAGRWPTTTPTNSVFSVKYNYEHVSTNRYVAYCWAPIAGYSAFGTYTGNNASDGPFVYTGFRPRFVMIKRTTTGNWNITDTSRNPYNNTTVALRPNSAATESTVGTVYVQPLSNGFKITNNNTDTNGTGTYIYACWAEAPFKFANAR
jgi:hypothetical protein